MQAALLLLQLLQLDRLGLTPQPRFSELFGIKILHTCQLALRNLSPDSRSAPRELIDRFCCTCSRLAGLQLHGCRG